MKTRKFAFEICWPLHTYVIMLFVLPEVVWFLLTNCRKEAKRIVIVRFRAKDFIKFFCDLFFHTCALEAIVNSKLSFYKYKLDKSRIKLYDWKDTFGNIKEILDITKMFWTWLKTILDTWTMSDMVKYRAALWSFLKLTALVFYHVWHSPSLWGKLF